MSNPLPISSPRRPPYNVHRTSGGVGKLCWIPTFQRTKGQRLQGRVVVGRLECIHAAITRHIRPGKLRVDVHAIRGAIFRKIKKHRPARPVGLHLPDLVVVCIGAAVVAIHSHEQCLRSYCTQLLDADGGGLMVDCLLRASGRRSYRDGRVKR
jgi:hypothetical protein